MRIPSATYRLQLTPSFGFSHVRQILPYLSELGISDVYASPVFAARSGSTHGYDVVNPNVLNPELGTEEEFNALVAEVRAHGMGWVQDIVPNHMAFDSRNELLMDVLEQGKASPFADYFDIEWHHSSESLHEKVLVPFLGKLFGECLEAGELQVRYTEQGFRITYYDLTLPVRIESYLRLLTSTDTVLEEVLGKEHPDFQNFEQVVHALRNLPKDPAERTELLSFVKRTLWNLSQTSDAIRGLIEDALRGINGTPGEPASFNALDSLLAEQWYRLAFWKVATEEVNYRRFFNINQLISVRVEDPSVFEGTHRLIARLCQEKKITGLRIDHIDGLMSPLEYLKRLRSFAPDVYLVVEKILHPDERLPSQWPVQGTSGYDFLNAVNGVFCERKNDRRFDKVYARFAVQTESYDDLVTNTKRLIIGRHMAGDVDRLAHLLKNISGKDRHARDITLYGLRRALVEILAVFPVYRSYVSQEVYDDQDRQVIREAIEKAERTAPALVLELEFIGRFLRLEYPDYLAAEDRTRWVEFVMRFQQLTGPLMAKGFEDTALYRYNKLISLNDVGGSPHRFGISGLEFHYFNKRRTGEWPHAMNCTATHDTKRGEDVRARLNVLSEIPEEWARKIRTWNKINAGNKAASRREIPDRNDEYFLYQTLVGSYPLRESDLGDYPRRIKEYAIKAVREAKVHTAWLKPDAEYEEGFLRFIDQILKPGGNPFLEDFVPFVRRTAQFGYLNSLSQLLLKATCPGVPDFYQGSELWELSLVDPDNRRPVDFAGRAAILDELRKLPQGGLASYLESTLKEPDDGRVKLFTTAKVLQIRRNRQKLFTDGSYLPLSVHGKHRNHVLAFARRVDAQWALILAPRRHASLSPNGALPLGSLWEDTSVKLPRGAGTTWENVFTGETLTPDGSSLNISDVCAQFPLGLLIQ